jgi:RNA polymerase sigma-70 factor (ECF subfamily)
LPDTFRQAVWLRDVEELTYAEIAGVLDVPIGTVMSRISRGRRLLFDRLTAARLAGGDSGHAAAGESGSEAKIPVGRQKADVV